MRVLSVGSACGRDGHDSSMPGCSARQGTSAFPSSVRRRRRHRGQSRRAGPAPRAQGGPGDQVRATRSRGPPGAGGSAGAAATCCGLSATGRPTEADGQRLAPSDQDLTGDDDRGHGPLAAATAATHDDLAAQGLPVERPSPVTTRSAARAGRRSRRPRARTPTPRTPPAPSSAQARTQGHPAAPAPGCAGLTSGAARAGPGTAAGAGDAAREVAERVLQALRLLRTCTLLGPKPALAPCKPSSGQSTSLARTSSMPRPGARRASARPAQVVLRRAGERRHRREPVGRRVPDGRQQRGEHPAPPSFVAEPPSPTTIRRAPASTAASSSVADARGSRDRGVPPVVGHEVQAARLRRLDVGACGAVRSGPAGPARAPAAAADRRPVTSSTRPRRAAARTSTKPGPPSDRGRSSSSSSGGGRRQPVGHGLGRLAGGQGAGEGVGGDQHAHHDSLAPSPAPGDRRGGPPADKQVRTRPAGPGGRVRGSRPPARYAADAPDGHHGEVRTGHPAAAAASDHRRRQRLRGVDRPAARRGPGARWSAARRAAGAARRPAALRPRTPPRAASPRRGASPAISSVDTAVRTGVGGGGSSTPRGDAWRQARPDLDEAHRAGDAAASRARSPPVALSACALLLKHVGDSSGLVCRPAAQDITYVTKSLVTTLPRALRSSRRGTPDGTERGADAAFEQRYGMRTLRGSVAARLGGRA